MTQGACYYCASINGRILAVDEPIPAHPNCKYHVEVLTTIAVDTATAAGASSMDLYVALLGKLPDSYITDANAEVQGWKK